MTWLRRSGLLAAAALLASLACQAVVGDFTVDDAPEAPPPGLARVCEPNSFRCEDDRLVTCSADRSGYVLVERCGDADHCDPSAAACRTCLAGEWACNDGALETCDESGAWVPGPVCASSALCRVSVDRSEGSCAEPACDAPGAHACENGLLLRCGQGLETYTLVDRCTSPETCDAAVADAQTADVGSGTCLESLPEPCDPGSPTCETESCGLPGALRCVSGDLTVLQRCGNAGRWAVSEACATAALCSETAGGCLAPACELGGTRCLGQTFQRCSDDLTRWLDADQCSPSETCGPSGCSAEPCLEATYRCNGPSLELCTYGRFEPRARCATSALCDAVAGVCGEPVCGAELGDFQCAGTNLERCVPGRTGWADFRYCPGGCEIQSGVPLCQAAAEL